MTSETAAVKAQRLLCDNRVTITAVSQWHIEAVVEGDSGRYACGYISGRYWCDCACLRICSHLLAVQAVTPTVATWLQTARAS